MLLGEDLVDVVAVEPFFLDNDAGEDVFRFIEGESEGGLQKALATGRVEFDFDLFEQLVVFARGDIIGTKLRRRLRKMYRRESVAVPIYQRMVVLFRLHDDDKSEEKLTAAALHLRMFKNIPKQDVDMLLPGTRVRISGVDHFKILLPSLGGLLLSLRKIAQYYHDNVPGIFLHEEVQVDGVKNRVKNYNPVNRVINWHEITIDG